MKTYIFNIPDNWNLKNCFVKLDNNTIILDKPIDHGIYERIMCDIYEINDETAKDIINKVLNDESN